MTKQGTCRIRSIDGSPVNTSVQVWTGEEWIDVRGVQSVSFTASVNELNQIEIHCGLVVSDLTVLPEYLTIRAANKLESRHGEEGQGRQA